MTKKTTVQEKDIQKNETASTPADASADDILKIDVDGVLRERLGGKYRWIPRFLVRKLEKIICQDRLNALLESNRGKRDAEFCRGVLADLNVKVEVEGAENLPGADDRRVLFVCNHPLGGLDGMALIDLMHSHFGGHINFIVNDLLWAVKPLRGVFVPINKHGAQSREAVAGVDNAFAEDNPLIMFPAGLVSRMQRKKQKDGKGKYEIKDLEWQKMFVGKVKKYHRDIIPIHFIGENSPFFYKFARNRNRLGIKFNIEMIYLPAEVFKSENKTFKVVIGKRIPWEELPAGKPSDIAEAVKEKVYALAPSDGR